MATDSRPSRPWLRDLAQERGGPAAGVPWLIVLALVTAGFAAARGLDKVYPTLGYLLVVLGAWYAVQGTVAVITLENPPVNGLGYEVRNAVLAALDRAAEDPAVQAIVLAGAGAERYLSPIELALSPDDARLYVVCESSDELAVVDVPEEFIGIVTERLSARRGRMVKMINHGYGRVRLEFEIPSRGLIGLRGSFLNDTRGTGLLNTILIGYTPYAGEIAGRPNGVLVSDRPGKAVAYAIFHLQPRGTIFVKPNDPVYRGLIVGENTRPDDMMVNITKEKKQTNIRAANTDEALRLVPPRQFSLEQSMEFINDDELVEVTPASIRLRKKMSE